MHFPEKFYRLPLRFDHAKLLEEISAVDESHWSPHPQAFKGNDALILLSNGGTINDLNYGPMEFTPCMQQLPYLKQVLESFNTIVGRTRLMRLAPGEKVGRHSDVSLYWWHRFRIHVPIVTHPEVKFYCEDTHVHMQAGEAWTFDNWRYHEVHNNSDITRVHLVIDTVGSPELWRMLENESWNPQPGETHTPAEFKNTLIPFRAGKEAHFEREQHNIVGVLSPAELDAIADFLIGDVDTNLLDSTQLQSVMAHLRYLKRAWRALFSVRGRDESYYQDYSNLLLNVVKELNAIEPKPTLKSNGFILAGVLKTQVSLTIQDVISKQITAGFTKHFSDEVLPVPKASALKLNTAQTQANNNITSHKILEKPSDEAPIFIVSVPHAGGDFVEKLLGNSQAINVLNDSSKQKINQNFQSSYKNTQLDDIYNGTLPKDITGIITSGFLSREQKIGQQTKVIYFDNYLSLRIKSLFKQFPKAKFIYVYQEPSKNLSQLKLDWLNESFLNDFASTKIGRSWHHPLPANWQSHDLNQLDDCLSFQYTALNETMMAALANLPKESVFCLDFQDITLNLRGCVEALCEFCAIPFGPKMQSAASQNVKEVETNRMVFKSAKNASSPVNTYAQIQQWAKTFAQNRKS